MYTAYFSRASPFALLGSRVGLWMVKRDTERAKFIRSCAMLGIGGVHGAVPGRSYCGSKKARAEGPPRRLRGKGVQESRKRLDKRSLWRRPRHTGWVRCLFSLCGRSTVTECPGLGKYLSSKRVVLMGISLKRCAELNGPERTQSK